MVFLGYPVRRASWVHGEHLFLGQGTHNGLPKVMFWTRDAKPARFKMSPEEFHALDWVVLS